MQRNSDDVLPDLSEGTLEYSSDSMALNAAPSHALCFPPGSPVKAETSIRVQVRLLDTLMTLAGELVLCRNQLLQAINSNNQRATEAATQRINLITSDLRKQSC